MRRIAILLLLVSIALVSRGQITELGIHFGGSYYLGDVNPTQHFYNPRTSQGLTLRHNFNNRMAVRLNLINTTIAGSDADFTNEFQQQRNHSFNTQLNTFTAQMEYNFFPSWYEGNNIYRITPYTAIGFGMVYSENGKPSSMLPILPIGIGGKIHVSKKLSANLEWGFRLTYSDYLDQLSNPYQENNQLSSRAKQVTFAKNKDLYSVFGLMLTYRIFTDKHVCPAYGNIQ